MVVMAIVDREILAAMALANIAKRVHGRVGQLAHEKRALVLHDPAFVIGDLAHGPPQKKPCARAIRW
jgi:hypothetical protein